MTLYSDAVVVGLWSNTLTLIAVDRETIISLTHLIYHNKQ